MLTCSLSSKGGRIRLVKKIYWGTMERMRKSLLVVFWVGVSAVDAASRETWSYHLPSSGVLPSYYAADVSSSMGERHGGSTLGIVRATLNVPLCDPYRSGLRNWAFAASLNAEFTSLSTSGSLDLRRDALYSLTLPLSLIRSEASGNRLVVVLAPMVASDFTHSDRVFDMGGLVSYSVKESDAFRYGVGLGIAPRYTQNSVIPFFSFEWRASELWTVTLDGYRLFVKNSLNDRWTVGGYVGAYGGAWSVKTAAGTRLFRIRSLATGFLGEYDFSRQGERKRIVFASLGAMLATRVDFCRFNADLDAEETHHYHSGLLFSVGADFRF